MAKKKKTWRSLLPADVSQAPFPVRDKLIAINEIREHINRWQKIFKMLPSFRNYGVALAELENHIDECEENIALYIGDENSYSKVIQILSDIASDRAGEYGSITHWNLAEPSDQDTVAYELWSDTCQLMEFLLADMEKMAQQFDDVMMGSRSEFNMAGL